MIVTLQAVRIYGSKNQYGPTPQFCPMDGPIVLENFPGKTERSLILLGTLPEPILRANKVRKAIGIVAFEVSFGKAQDSAVNRDMLIKEKLGELTDSLKVADYNWCITVIVERKINADIADREYLWLDWGKARELEKDFEAYASPCIDLLATYVSTVIERFFFEEVIIDDCIFFLAAGRESFGLPRFSACSDVKIGMSEGSLDLEKLGKLFQKVASLPQSQLQWLKTMGHWRLAALRDKDPMKRFLCSFFALEILTHKLFKLVGSKKGVIVKEYLVGLWFKLLGCKKGSKKQLSLREEFETVALSLFPSSATADVEDFVRAKDARDKLSHGVLEKVAELPTSMVTVLLEKYLAGAVKFQLKM